MSDRMKNHWHELPEENDAIDYGREVKRKPWPASPDPEVDGVCFVPADIPYRVLSESGRVLGTFSHRAGAMAAFSQWAQAAWVVIGSLVVAERDAKGGGA